VSRAGERGGNPALFDGPKTAQSSPLVPQIPNLRLEVLRLFMARPALSLHRSTLGRNRLRCREKRGSRAAPRSSDALDSDRWPLAARNRGSCAAFGYGPRNEADAATRVSALDVATRCRDLREVRRASAPHRRRAHSARLRPGRATLTPLLTLPDGSRSALPKGMQLRVDASAGRPAQEIEGIKSSRARAKPVMQDASSLPDARLYQRVRQRGEGSL